MSIREIAERYTSAGLSVVPIRADGTKAPAIHTWRELQSRIGTPIELDSWFANGCGIAVIGGAVSGGLEIIDFDAVGYFERFVEAVESVSPGLIERLPHVATPGDGHHLFLRCCDVAGNQKLAMSAENKELIETRGQGGYVVAPGSPARCHTSGRLYQHVGGPALEDVPTITSDERNVLLRVARSFDERPQVETRHEPTARPERSGLSPGDDFATRTSWDDILTPHGWTRVSDDLWRRPNKTIGVSASTKTTSKSGNELIVVFSSNAHPFEATSYNKFSAFALLNHGGDFAAAASELGRLGYGEQTTSGSKAKTPAIQNCVIAMTGEDGKPGTIPRPMRDIIASIKSTTGGWPKRVGSALFACQDGRVDWLESTSSLFGYLHSVGNDGVRWTRGDAYVTKEELFAELRRTSEAFVAIEELPHEPPIVGHHYLCDVIEPGDGTALSGLLDRFSPATQIDRDLLQAAIVTPAWGGPAGARPAFVITSDFGRGSGKSTATKIISHIWGGELSFSAGDDINKMRTRLLSPDALTRRVAVLDNVKSHRFSWAEWEGLLTASSIGGHRMYVGEASRPNTLTWFVTLNGASLSTDVAQRSAIIKLAKPKRSGTWEETTIAYVDQHRAALIADCIGFLRGEIHPLARFTRWATWEKDVLQRLPEPGEAQKVIVERQDVADVEADEADIIEEFIAERLSDLSYQPETHRVLIPSAIVADWFCRATNERTSTVAVGRKLGQMIDEGRLPRIERNKCLTWGRGFVWHGTAADVSETVRLDIQERIDRQKNGWS